MSEASSAEQASERCEQTSGASKRVSGRMNSPVLNAWISYVLSTHSALLGCRQRYDKDFEEMVEDIAFKLGQQSRVLDFIDLLWKYDA